MRSDLKPNDFYMYFYGLSRKKEERKMEKMKTFNQSTNIEKMFIKIQKKEEKNTSFVGVVGWKMVRKIIKIAWKKNSTCC